MSPSLVKNDDKKKIKKENQFLESCFDKYLEEGSNYKKNTNRTNSNNNLTDAMKRILLEKHKENSERKYLLNNLTGSSTNSLTSRKTTDSIKLPKVIENKKTINKSFSNKLQTSEKIYKINPVKVNVNTSKSINRYKSDISVYSTKNNNLTYFFFQT